MTKKEILAKMKELELQLEGEKKKEQIVIDALFKNLETSIKAFTSEYGSDFLGDSSSRGITIGKGVIDSESKVKTTIMITLSKDKK